MARHPIAPTLLMVIMLASGLLAAGRIETRFFPKYDLQIVVINVTWSGAAAEDVDDSIITPLQKHLRNVDNYKKIYSFARDGGALVYLEFPQNADINLALDDVRRQVDLAASALPADSEAPEVSSPSSFDGDLIMRLSLAGSNLAELRPFARQMEQQLLNIAGVSAEVSGLPKDEIEIRLSQRQLAQLELSLRDVGRQIAAQNVDISAGDVQGELSGRRLRATARQQDIAGLANVRILDGAGRRTRLGDIADIARVNNDDEITLLFNGRPAVEFLLKQSAGSDIFTAADRINEWLDKNRPTLPPGISLTAHDEAYTLIQSRTNLLLRNGAQGLILVMALLFLFLNARVAIWVAVGIPATFMVALSALFFTGGTINMLSLFAFIMTTGIVVDDAIVVGENAHYRLRRGETAMPAAIRGAKEMFSAITASTFTTVAAFMPLFAIGGIIGAILFDIPLVVVCVLSASLFECFMVLPGHLAGAFSRMSGGDNRLRALIERGFAHLQESWFRTLVQTALRYRLATLTLAFTALAISIAMIVSGTVKYRFFAGGELGVINVEANFVAGTPQAEVAHFAAHLEESLLTVAASFADEKDLLVARSMFFARGGERQAGGKEKLKMRIELSEPDSRTVTSEEFLRVWREQVRRAAGLETLKMKVEEGGPPGEDLEVRLSGSDIDTLKSAAMALQNMLLGVPGLSLPRDDMPYGQRQEVFALTPLGEALGLSVEDVAAQLRDSFDGYKAQTFYEGVDEIDLRVMLAGAEQDSLRELTGFLIRLPDGRLSPLQDVVRLQTRQGFDQVQRVGADTVVNVNAEVDFKITDVAQLQSRLLSRELPSLAAQYGVAYSFEGSSSDERETVEDMKIGLVAALLMIYIILAAVFGSWTLPLVVLFTVPLSLAGAVFGHWLMGYTMSILSTFGIFTLNGIVINNAIILLREYMARRRAAPEAATNGLIADATCRRLRAMLLTSCTTIAGLTPLMFESSTQAQFLIPMAISICFGLAFATVLILIVAPVYLSYHESAGRILGGMRRWFWS